MLLEIKTWYIKSTEGGMKFGKRTHAKTLVRVVLGTAAASDLGCELLGLRATEEIFSTGLQIE